MLKKFEKMAGKIKLMLNTFYSTCESNNVVKRKIQDYN